MDRNLPMRFLSRRRGLSSPVSSKRLVRGLGWGVLLGLWACAATPPQEPLPLVFPPVSLADLADQLKPLVVHVRTYAGSQTERSLQDTGPSQDLREFFRPFSGPPFSEEVPAGGTGAGFLIDPDGFILTNHHVVQGAEQITVRLANGRELPARLVGDDPRTDLALLKVEAAQKLPAAQLGNSDKLRVGDGVLAIGHPFGLEQTLTAGIVSAKGRVLGIGSFDDFIQTDASLRAGSSGGPLFNLQGEVVGVNTAIVPEASGIGFAIPVNLVKHLLPDLKIGRRVRRGWIGIAVQDLQEEVVLHLDLDSTEGALVTEVIEGGPAEEAGFHPGDVILESGGVQVTQSQNILRAIAEAPVGATLALRVFRAGKRFELEVQIEELREVPSFRPRRRPPSHLPLGLDLKPITSQITEQLDLKDPAGLFVRAVDEEGPAYRVGVQPGDVLRAVNLEAVRTVEAYEAILTAAKGPTVLLLLEREHQRFFRVVRWPERSDPVSQLGK